MTDEQALQIRKIRAQGMGYRANRHFFWNRGVPVFAFTIDGIGCNILYSYVTAND